MAFDGDGPVKLTPDKTWIPVGVAVSAIMAFAGGAVWINNQLQTLAFSLSRVESKVNDLQDRWSRDQMQNWVEILKARNSTLNVPEVR